MAKPNFSFQKRQKELARQKKQDEKKQRKLEKSETRPDDQAVGAADDTDKNTVPSSERNESA